MGIAIDHNHRYTEEERNYLIDRGRAYLLPANERRFGTNENPREPEPHEQHDSEAISPFYQSQDRHAAIYDVGGAPLPGAVLSYDTGRAYDRENGVEVEFTGPGHTPGANDLSSVREYEGFDGYDVDENGNPIDDSIDDDIVEKVVAIANKTELKKELQALGVEFHSDDSREDLENTLAVALQDQRDSEKN